MTVSMPYAMAGKTRPSVSGASSSPYGRFTFPKNVLLRNMIWVFVGIAPATEVNITVCPTIPPPVVLIVDEPIKVYVLAVVFTSVEE